MSILFQIQNLNLAFGEKVIFKNAQLSVEKGDRIGLIGLNGHGKSTLFKIIQQEVTPDRSEPPFLFDTHNTEFSCFYIPQEMQIDPKQKIENYYLLFYPELKKYHEELEVIAKKIVEDPSEKNLFAQQDIYDKIDHLNGWELEQNYQNYLQYFGLESNHKTIETLSGGEQRKIALAIGLSSQAKIILWDEPTNHLDTVTIELFEEELKKTDKTFIIISHDRYLLNEVTTKIVHIEKGQITTFKGNYLEYLDYQEEKTKELAKNLDKLENKHRRELEWMRQGVKARRTRSKKRVESYHVLKKEMETLKDSARKKIQLSLQHSGKKSKLLWEIKEGFMSFDDKELLKHLNLKIYKDDKIALLGANGAGKSTLIKIITGALQANQGTINQPTEVKSVVFDQKRESLPENKTLFEFIGDGQDQVHLPSGRSEHVIGYLQKFLFHKNQINRPIHTLSGGEKNRLQLANFMKHAADLWVFDEPTNDLDIETIEMLEETLSNYSQAIIIISHDRAFIDKVCKKSWLITDQEVEIFEGGYSQLADYIQARDLLKKIQPEKPESKSNTEKPKNQEKMSYKEKLRWEVIEEEIAMTEESVATLEKEMSEFDFTQTDYQKAYQELEANFNKSKDALDKLYSEWEYLSDKKI